MKIDEEVTAAALSVPEADYPWLKQAPTREDRIAETVAIIALVFAIGVGLVIALLPVTVKATSLDQTMDGHSARAVLPSHAVHAAAPHARRPAAASPVAPLGAPAR